MPSPLDHQKSSPYRADAMPDAVFFVGDSITFGWRDEDIGGWPTRLISGLSNWHAVTAYNLGVRGDTSRSIRARWHDEVSRRRQAPHSVVVFAFGANDAKLYPDGQPFVPLAETRSNVADILTSAQNDHILLFIGPAPIEETVLGRVLNPEGTGPVPTNRQVEIVSGVLAEEAARANVPFLDLFNRLGKEEQWFDSLRETDGIHPPARGHDLIASLVDAWQPWATLFKRGTTE